MAQRGFSARGEIVDFELLRIKEQLASVPAPTTVSARRTFIEEKAGLTKRETAKPSDALLAGAVGFEEQAIVEDAPEVESVSEDLISESDEEEELAEEPVVATAKK